MMFMALPMDYDSLRVDESSERASSVEDYKVTCIAFIKDISTDYLEWVEYYKLPPEEDKKRREEIAAIIERTNEWIAKVAQTIKGVDVIMNDGVQKMAEATAGKPFPIDAEASCNDGVSFSMQINQPESPLPYGGTLNITVSNNGLSQTYAGMAYGSD